MVKWSPWVPSPFHNSKLRKKPQQEAELLGLFRVAAKVTSGNCSMSRSDEYRRFASECLKMARTAEDEQNRAIFLQMAQALFALAQKGETNADED